MPLPADVQICSVDDHVVEHRDAFKGRLPAKFGDRGPRIVEVTGETVDPLGNVHTGTQQVWEIDGTRYPTIGLNAVAGKPKEEIGLEPVRFDEMRPGCYDIDERIKDMDQDGVHAQLCFPSLPGFAGSTFFDMADKELAHACVQAWNDFAIDEWCAAYPGRQIPLVILPYWDVDLSTAEVQRAAAKGAKAVSFTESPARRGPSVVAQRPLGQPPRRCSGRRPAGVPPLRQRRRADVAPDANFAVAIALFGTNSQFAMTDLLLSPVFHKFPRLKVALSEGGIGWMPWLLERIDYTWERHRHYTGCNPDVRPSDLFRQHIFGCFISDDAGIDERHRIGVDNIMFESDYPHSDSNWPSQPDRRSRRCSPTSPTTRPARSPRTTPGGSSTSLATEPPVPPTCRSALLLRQEGVDALGEPGRRVQGALGEPVDLPSAACRRPDRMASYVFKAMDLTGGEGHRRGGGRHQAGGLRPAEVARPDRPRHQGSSTGRRRSPSTSSSGSRRPT